MSGNPAVGVTDGLFSCTLVRVATYDNWDYGANVHHMVGVRTPLGWMVRLRAPWTMLSHTRYGTSARFNTMWWVCVRLLDHVDPVCVVFT